MIKPTEEKLAISQGYKLIGAIDEAGRGPLAGPVVAACVIIPDNFDFNKKIFKEIKDSKLLNFKKREELFKILLETLPDIGVGVCDHSTIDRINILEATFLAMKKAIGTLKTKPEFILVDGQFKIPNISIKQKAIVNGDNLVLTIAAASIIAKVKRDKIMEEFHGKYPQYGFNAHKGYGTKQHIQKLKEHGPCPIHRRTFAPVKELI